MGSYITFLHPGCQCMPGLDDLTGVDGGCHPCGDYRQLNDVTMPDRYPVQHIQDFSACLAGKMIFSKVDLHTIRQLHSCILCTRPLKRSKQITWSEEMTKTSDNNIIWPSYLSFTTDIRHIERKSNAVADCLSRATVQVLGIDFACLASDLQSDPEVQAYTDV
ncbi:hypothetical protein QQF64_027064 [Cirrhinus molitorella]|uniref:RNase H type-1 domain-containing protein n=1 Tax=Cirrhinus molitorella TaxID=172907 RepID=A0ABR3NBE9_9TELE